MGARGARTRARPRSSLRGVLAKWKNMDGQARDRGSSNDEWLMLARQATGLAEIGSDKLTVVGGVLTGLNLCGLGLTTVPESIGQLSGLTVLSLNKNRLTSVPESIGQLKMLQTLDLGENNLASLPQTIGQLATLTLLDLSRNGFTTLPESIGQLTALKKLNLIYNKLTSVPESIGQLTGLVELDLKGKGLVSVPESIGQLTGLTLLDLSWNKLKSVPESIGQLKMLQSLNLCENYLNSLPQTIGQLTTLTKLRLNRNEFKTVPECLGQLTGLIELNLSNNRLTSVPEVIRQLTCLTELKLGGNNLQGEVPLWLNRSVNLRALDLSNNADLFGSLPSISCNVIIRGTKIRNVKIKTKALKRWWDYMFVAVHALMGYADLTTDVLSIIQLGQHGQRGLMGLNVAFLLFNVFVDVLLQSDLQSRVLAMLQLQQAVQAWETLRSGEQTASFVRSKKVDAVCRSMPSIVLQLYGLLLSLTTLGASGVATIGLSVAVGVGNSAATLGSLAPKSGTSIFSFAFRVHLCYFVCELTARLISMGLLFVSLGPVAFVLLAADFFWRIIRASGYRTWSISDILQALLWFGSDGIDGPGETHAIIMSIGSGIVMLMSLFIVNMLRTTALRVLRSNKGGPVQVLTALACVSLLFKLFIGNYINRTTFREQSLSLAEPPSDDLVESKPKQQSLPEINRRASSRVSFDLTYSDPSPSDPIPKRLPSSSDNGSLSVGSVKVMHDNPLRLSDAQAPPQSQPPPHAPRLPEAKIDTHVLDRNHGHGQANPLHTGSDAV